MARIAISSSCHALRKVVQGLSDVVKKRSPPTIGGLFLEQLRTDARLDIQSRMDLVSSHTEFKANPSVCCNVITVLRWRYAHGYNPLFHYF